MKKNKNNHWKKITIGFFSLFFALFIVSQSFAQTILPLTVYPARQQLEVDPGEKTAVTVNFVNKNDQPISGFFKVVDFVVLDKNGTPTFIENSTQINPKFSAASWFNLYNDRGTIPANEKISIQANINVPVNAKPGGRYVALYFEPTTTNFTPSGKEKEANTGIAPRLASLIYIKVKGPIKEAAWVTRFFTKSFWEFGPIDVETEILNRGDYHISPQGAITLYNFFGNRVDQQKLEEQNIFPDVSKTYKNKIGSRWMLGRYRLDLTGSYGNSGRSLTASLYFWVFPWRLSLIVVLSLVILFIFIRELRKNAYLKQKELEKELEHEREEIEKLKEELKKREE
jgi:hypothetical protein